MSVVSEQYAIALFELAIENNLESKIDEAFDTLSQALDDEVKAFFDHPRIRKEEKKTVLKASELPPLFFDFLCVLIDYNRFNLVDAIFADYQKISEKREGIMRLHVFSGQALNDERIEQLKQSYEKKYRRTIIIENKIDASVLGGIRVEYNGLVLDDTVNAALNRLKTALKK